MYFSTTFIAAISTGLGVDASIPCKRCALLYSTCGWSGLLSPDCL